MSMDPEEQVRRFVAANLRAAERQLRARRGELVDLEIAIADALAAAKDKLGKTWAQLRERHRTVVQQVPRRRARGAAVRGRQGGRAHGIQATLEQAALEWLSTELDLDDFHRAVLGVIEPPDDSALHLAT